VRPEGIDLTYIPANPGETFWRQLQHAEYDVSEMSMSAYITLSARSDQRFVAIPVFTSRAFRHGCIFVRSGGKVRVPEDLAGARIGVPQYHMTAALWIRGILSDDYGVGPESVTWVQGGLDTAGYPERIAIDIPPRIRVEHEQARSLSEMLLAGDIDAIIGAEYPRPFIQEDARVVRLFSEHVRVEREYFTRTRCFPIMHCVVVDREIYQRHRWIARNLLAAFDASKRLAEAQMAFPGAPVTMLPWQVDDWADARSLMGVEFWPYGIELNRREIESMCRYSFEQGLADSLMSAESLFASETLASLPASVSGA
jgi:4,5-dihydroxyphthalate decarboxylase